MSQVDLRRLVNKYCKMNHIRNNFSQKRQSAGRDWFEAFLRRHSDLSVRKPKPTSVHRAIGFNSAKPSSF